MNWDIVSTLIPSLLAGGTVTYLVVEKLFDRRKDNAEVRHREVESMRETVEFGIPMISIYNEIDKIVEGKTRPIQDKLDIALDKIDVLEANACFRRDCPSRINRRNKDMEDLADEAQRVACKGKR